MAFYGKREELGKGLSSLPGGAGPGGLFVTTTGPPGACLLSAQDLSVQGCCRIGAPVLGVAHRGHVVHPMQRCTVCPERAALLPLGGPGHGCSAACVQGRRFAVA